MKWYFITSLELFHHFGCNEMTFLHESWVSFHDKWRGGSRVTSHEMKRKTSEEMSFHFTQSDEITKDEWWNIISFHKKCQQFHFKNLYIGETIYFTILVRKRTRKIQWYEPYMYCTVRTPYNFMKKRRRYPYNYPYIWPLTEPNSWLSIDFHSIFQWFLWFYSKNWDLR